MARPFASPPSPERSTAVAWLILGCVYVLRVLTPVPPPTLRVTTDLLLPIFAAVYMVALAAHAPPEDGTGVQ